MSVLLSRLIDESRYVYGPNLMGKTILEEVHGTITKWHISKYPDGTEVVDGVTILPDDQGMEEIADFAGMEGTPVDYSKLPPRSRAVYVRYTYPKQVRKGDAVGYGVKPGDVITCEAERVYSEKEYEQMKQEALSQGALQYDIQTSASHSR